MRANRSVLGEKSQWVLSTLKIFLTSKWAIWAISLWDAADFVLEGVENALWRSAPRRSFLLFKNKFGFAPRPKPICQRALGLNIGGHGRISLKPQINDHSTK